MRLRVRRSLMDWLQIAGAVFLIWLVLVFLFTPGINYHLSRRTSVHAEDFLYTLQSTCQAALHHGNRVTIFTERSRVLSGDARRDPQRDAVGQHGVLHLPAGPHRRSVHRRARRIARARGVNVTIVVDAIGSFNLWGRPVRRLREAGCRIESYQRLRWYSLARLNNRTHRELLVVDGRVAFAGGAGIADWWAYPARARGQPWRDTMAQFEGPIVAALQGVAAENWLECCGEILTGPEYFPEPRSAPATRRRSSIKSSPSDRATASRVTFQLLMEGADHEVRISTPYFLPDRALRRALMEIAAARRRRSR